ncbi:unsaturated rhamnogalacturonyl hydrolase YteR [Anaerocolumna cellulosilytica]|uniref:Unsaturated rhamnogalacturonyl hydrolase YteR n=1 Tax=Anaerocolumna cellulosilytica TaxID=433286 RepID=A0A6S6R1L3_9FIRM|nr:glycoside hydrolase family 88 protein [Anaerocolumna cellulosilytica]MBB5196695.1 unsaturated rhamnogalacturonyl hydrolase [Anaerocolumna cellulosilytica]BCJ93957.1 unsaturated rhamnogalacturonyl hydrolase YteR [Anaerocolumna cellulosilytica]
MTTVREKTPLYYGELACDTLMAKYRPEELPPKGRFHYHQGVFLSGMEQCYFQNRDEKYYNYIKDWVDSIIDEDGKVTEYDATQLDDLQPCILLFHLYEKTKDERYKTALHTLIPLVKGWKTNSQGGFWHKEIYPNQMWLDGLYMGGPFSVHFGKTFAYPEYFDLITHQALLMYEHTRDFKTGLLYHGWDETREAIWAHPATGKAPEFWGRAIGWYPVALLDIFDYLPEEHSKKPELVLILQDLLKSLVPFQDESTGLWYQVVDKVNESDNWLETSCTCLFVCALAKAVRMGYLHKIYLKYAWKGFDGVINRLKYDENGGIVIDGVCIGTGIGDYTHYINRPTSVNDLHGAGAFILMCAEMNLAETL